MATRGQLLALGLSSEAIVHRIRTGRLHPVHRGVYAVGRRELSRLGGWMAAVLACGPGAVLSHLSAAAHYAIFEAELVISLSVPRSKDPRPPGLRVHRVELAAPDASIHDGIPVTSHARTLIDLATELPLPRLERAVNQADKRG